MSKKDNCMCKYILPTGILLAVILPFLILNWCPTSCSLHKENNTSKLSLTAPDMSGMANKAKGMLNAFGEAIGDFFSWSLPNGLSLNIPKGGLEEKFLTALKDGNADSYYVFDRIFFESGSAQINQSSDEQIDNITKILNAYPEMNILLRGHTDSTGDASFNQQLSLNRAKALRFKLIEKGVEAQRVEVEGLGPNQPIADNNTAQGRRLNRRIDISIRR